jgi:alkylation response protein AidB-like acyl-CoA dehydrogenase
MSTLSPGELADFSASVDKSLRKVWQKPTVAGDADAHQRVADAWDVAVEQGLTSLAGERALDAALAAVSVTGLLCLPVPLMDSFVAHMLASSRPDLQERIESGEIRPIICPEGDHGRRFAEAAGAATHVLQFAPDGAAAVLSPVASVVYCEGIAKPDWADVAVNETGSETMRLEPQAKEQAIGLLRLGLVARGLAAAEFALKLSVEHANNRTAFGKPIGTFQAVSHRAANGATAVTAARLLVEEAAHAWVERRPDWNLPVELAVTFVADSALQTHFDAAHTLAATGFCDEHEAPWLFRRLNADMARLALFEPVCGGVAELLIEGGRDMPTPRLGDDAERFRAEVRELLDECGVTRDVDEAANARVVEGAKQRGYVTLAWPPQYGGKGASIEQEIVLAEEFKYARVPFAGKTAADLLGPTIIKFGTEEQKERFLPMLASGEFPFYLGYSEPEVGSDLANLRTRAVRDENEWVIDGQKSWGTKADIAEWVWLAARTDPNASRPHAGITVFLTRTDRPGFSLQKHRALSGDINCTTFFDSYRVPDADRVGEVNGGWRAITHALTKERVMMSTAAADVLRLLDDLLAEVRADPLRFVGSPGSHKRALLAQYAARLQAARLLVYAAARAVMAGHVESAAASMAKVIATPLQEDFCTGAIQILGPLATLGGSAAGTISSGAFDYNLRNSIKQVVGGGTIDIQRNLIARSLGLPR